MRFKNVAFRILISLKNALLRLLRKSRYGVLLEESVRWVFGRLPVAFTVPLALIAVFYFVLLYPVLVYNVPTLLDLPARGVRWFLPFGAVAEMGWGGYAASTAYRHLLNIVAALLTLCVALAGFVVSHAVACFFYRCWRAARPAGAKALPAARVIRPSAPRTAEEVAAATPNPLEGFSRIGIILAGGGAKGAYQAGAMKAVYEFLEEHGAHDKVKMIAGTSIGSWNALFWLADMVKDEIGPEGRRPGALEAWWKGVCVSGVIKPVKYLPTKQNFFLSNQPWQETFEQLFGERTEAGRRLLEHMDGPDDPQNINFYFTCTNIKEARLEVTTNDNRRVERRDPYLGGSDRLASMKATIAKNLDQVRFGVFSSMDLPPLFEYAAPAHAPGGNGNGNGTPNFYEDGGVIDNLPIYFGTEVEECDLLFILPLNASFEQEVNHSSLIKRLARVTSIRQGVLERKSFKDIYLFNESAYLRELAWNQDAALREVLGLLEAGGAGLPGAEGLAERVRGVLADPPPDGVKAAELTPLQRALKRRHKPVQVFSICPKPKPKLRINTAEFWKTEEAGFAFDRMYEATREGLRHRFEWLISQNFVTMVQIPDEGDPELFTDF